jgi:glycosyltransferase involved in cell wall biosynthesis
MKLLIIATELSEYTLHWRLIRDIAKKFDGRICVVERSGCTIIDAGHMMHRSEVLQLKAECHARGRFEILGTTPKDFLALANRLVQSSDVNYFYIGEPIERLNVKLSIVLMGLACAHILSTVCENEFTHKFNDLGRNGRSTLKLVLKKRILFQILQRIDCVFASSRESFLSIAKLGLSKNARCVSPFGYSRDMGPPTKYGKKSGPELKVGFVGRITEEKGIHLLLAAINRAPFTTLRVAGSGPDIQKAELYIRDQNLQSRVEICGLLNEVSLREFLSEIDLLACLSIPRPGWREQFGLAVVEAMSAGVPVLVSDSGSLPEVVGEGGLVIPAGCVDSIVDALKRLQDSPQLLAELGYKGRCRFEQNFANSAGARSVLANLKTQSNLVY